MKIIHVFLLSLLFFSALKLPAKMSYEDLSTILDERFQNKYDQALINNWFNQNVPEIKEILDKINAGEEEYEVAPFRKKYVHLEEEARKELKYMGIPDSFAEKIPILNMHPDAFQGDSLKGATRSYSAPGLIYNGNIPYAILIDIRTHRDVEDLEFTIFHEVGHVYQCLIEYAETLNYNFDSIITEKNKEALADIYSLFALVRRYRNDKHNFEKFIMDKKIWSTEKEWSLIDSKEYGKGYLNFKEMLYYSKQIYKIYVEKEKLNPSDFLKVAKSYISNSKMTIKDYEEFINKEVAPIFQLLEKQEEAEKFNERYPKLKALKEYIQSYF